VFWERELDQLVCNISRVSSYIPETLVIFSKDAHQWVEYIELNGVERLEKMEMLLCVVPQSVLFNLSYITWIFYAFNIVKRDGRHKIFWLSETNWK
jgi:hypothetical protein